MTNFITGARLSRRRIVFLFTAIVAAAGVAIGPSGSAAAGTIPSDARVVTVTPVFGPDAPNMPSLEEDTSSGQQVQQLVLAIAGVHWPYTPDVLPPFHHH